jgi:metallo-beta-lactamase family protein
MHIQFFGAARTVTGSMHLIEVNGSRVLLDCGLHQGKRKEAYELNRRIPFDPKGIHSLVLSHAHIDHSGNIPRLSHDGYRGPIFSTNATKDLCQFMLPDSAHIQEKDVEFVNKKRAKKGQALFEPLYTGQDALRSLELFEGFPYGYSFEAAPGVRAEFRDAGHILGSSSVHLLVTEGSRTVKIVFTGDIGRPDMPVIRDPEPPLEADVLITESTYGDRLHGTDGNLGETLRESIAATFARRGRVLIPAFSVGRTQSVVYHLHRLFDAGKLPPVPIFVDSPLSVNVTDVFRRHPECYDEETSGFLERSEDPFGFGRLQYVRTLEESKALNDRTGPFLVISASGMCESGRILHHLRHIAPRRENTILLVGFMAENTLGRRIQEGAKTIKVFGEEFPVKAEVKVISGFSGHADRDELLAFLGKLRAPPAKTFVVHGEEESAKAFAGSLGERGFPDVAIPAPGQRFEI